LICTALRLRLRLRLRDLLIAFAPWQSLGTVISVFGFLIKN
jgi:hypothetical protein